jgi:hypothetical protein
MKLNKELMNLFEKATWFMVVVDGRHDLYLDNERDQIVQNYIGREVQRYAGMGGLHYSVADTVKIVLT